MSFKNWIARTDLLWNATPALKIFFYPIALIVAMLLSISGAQAQVGIGFENAGAYQGTIGHNKGAASAYNCPDGTLLRGLYHVDKSMTAAFGGTQGMTSQVGLYCGTLTADASGNLTVTPSTPNGTPTLMGYGYNSPGTTRHGYCDSNSVVSSLGGYDRQTANVPWASSLSMVCRQPQRGTNDWVQFPTNGPEAVLVGVNEDNAVHTLRGPFCNGAYTAVTGIYRQSGGEGYDGINVYCGSIVQARFSAYLEFKNYAWNKTLGGQGWRVSLRKSGTELAGQGNMTPWSSQAANDKTKFTPGTEIYVLPGSGYGAQISQRPAGTNQAAYLVDNGTCANGIALTNQQDNSCGMTLTGLPDIAVHIDTPENPYERVNQSQLVNFRAVNMGPGAVDPSWGYAFTVTLPVGWQINDPMPSGCAISGSVLTCQINKSLAGSSANGQEGGALNYALNFTTNASVTKGSYPVPIRLLRSTPDASSDAARKDYNTANDTASDYLTYLPEPNLTLVKITKGGVGSFNFNFKGATGQNITETIVTRTPDTRVMGQSHSLDPDKDVQVTEVVGSGLWEMASVSCLIADTNASVNVTQNLASKSFTIPGSYVKDENDIVCTVTNQQQTIDTSKKADYPNGAGVLNGDIITYTLTTVVTGIATKNPIVLTDTLSTGLTYVGVVSQTPGSNYSSSASGRVLTFTLPAGTQPGTHSISYTARVNTQNAGSVSVNNSVKSNTGTCADCSTSNPVVTVETSKSSEMGNGIGVQAGDVLSYTLTTVIKGGPSGKDIVLTDTLGAGLSFDIVSDTGKYRADVSAAPVLKFTLPAGTPAGSYPVTYRATVNSAATTSITNSVVSDTGVCTDCSTTNPIVSIQTNKTTNVKSGTSVMLNDIITFTLSVTVADGKTTHPLELVDTMDAALQFQAIVGSAAPFTFAQTSSNPDVLKFTLPTGTAPGTYDVSYTAKVINDNVLLVKNQVIPSDGICQNCATTTDVTGMFTTKTASYVNGSFVQRGDTIRYAITVDVQGKNTSADTVVTDTLGAGLTYVAGSAQGSSFRIVDSGAPVLVFTLPANTPAGQHTVTYEARVVETGSLSNVQNGVKVDQGHCVDCLVVNPVIDAKTKKSNGLAANQAVTPGQIITYELVTEVTSSTGATGATTRDILLTDTIGAGLRYVPGSASGDFVVDETGAPVLKFSLISGTPVGTYKVTYQAEVLENARGSVTNDVTSSYGHCDACTVVNPISQVVTKKTSTPGDGAAVVADQEILYTLTVSVSGSATGQDTVLTDTLSAGLTYKPGSAKSIKGTPFDINDSGAPVLVFTLPKNAAVGDHVITYVATVNDDAKDEVTNNVVSDLGSCADCTVIHPISGIWVNKSADLAPGSSVRAGDVITYSLLLEIDGAANPEPVVLTDTLGAGLTYVPGSAKESKGGPFTIVDSGAPVLVFTLPAGAKPGTDHIVTYQARVNESATTAVSNKVTVSDGGHCVDCEVITPVSVVKTSKRNDVPAGTAVMGGQEITYTLAVDVSGAATSKDVVLTDTLGAGLEFVPGSVSGASFTSNVDNAPVLTFTLRSGAPVGVHTVSYKARVLQTATTSVSNQVVSDADPGPGPCQECTVVNTVSKVVTKKTSVPQASTVMPGDSIQYTLTVTVSDAATEKDVVLTDTLGAGLTYTSGSAQNVQGQPFNIVDSGAPVLVFTLPAGAAVGDHVVTYSAQVKGDATDEVQNNVVSNIGICDDCTVIHPISGVWVNKSADIAAGSSVRAGDVITYSLMVEIEGNASSDDVVLTDTLGAGLTYVPGSAKTTQGEPFIVDESGAPVLVFTLPKQAAVGSDHVVTYQARVNESATTAVSNKVIVSIPEACVTCDVTLPVSSASTVKTNDLAAGEIVMEGQEITYTLAVSVSGAATSKDIVLTDTLGAGLEFVPGSVSGTGFTSDVSQAPQLKFTLLAGADVGTHAVTYKARVLTGTSASSIINKVESDASQCQVANDCTVVNPVSTIKTQKTSDKGPGDFVRPEDVIRYSLTVTVSGDRTNKPVVLTDTLGDGLTYVDGSAQGVGFTANTSGAPVLVFTLAEGAAVGDHVITYDAVVNDLVDENGMLEVTNSVSSNFGTCDDCTTVVPVSPAEYELEVVKLAELQFIRRGEHAPFSIRAINRSIYPVRDAQVVDVMPVGFRYVNGSATVDGVQREPIVRGRTLTFDNINIAPSGETLIRLRLLALSTAGPGKYTNVAFANDKAGDRVSNEGRADIEILAEPVFDCGDVVGTVYDDLNRNGYRDDGEPGLPGVRVVTVNGQLITTDRYGRWHVPCAALPDQRIGSNFIAKIDDRTLPTGYRLTSENPRVVRLTAGKMTEVDFGAAISRVVRLDLQDNAFVPDEIGLQPAWSKQITQLIATLKPEISVLRISYHTSEKDAELAEPRVRNLRNQIMDQWRDEGTPYRLDIESSIEVAK